jgi:hypothetical protein
VADQLATPADLAAMLQSDVDTATATMLIELATSRVQGAVGQRIIDLTDTALIDVDDYANWSQWLELPQHPIRTVTTVVLDGSTITDYLLRKQKLWRLNGWLTNFWMPSQVAVTYSHGFPAGSQYLQLARSATLALAKMGYGNPAGLAGESIDDYRVTYDQASARMELGEPLRAALVAAYGTASHVTVSAQD